MSDKKIIKLPTKEELESMGLKPLSLPPELELDREFEAMLFRMLLDHVKIPEFNIKDVKSPK